jgi:hypothetical protein
MTDPKGTCDYVAQKEDPSNWHGDYRDDWMLDYEAPLALEQEVWECPHEALDGEEHRLFHTDPEDVPDDVDEREGLLRQSTRRAQLATSTRFDSTTRVRAWSSRQLQEPNPVSELWSILFFAVGGL